VSAAGVIYAAFELEQIKVFTVADRVVELAQQGLLPVTRPNASRALSRYWQDRPNRLTEHERRSVYGQALGKGGDQQSPQVNRDFHDLWMRFVSTASEYSRQRSTTPRKPAVKVSDAAVRKAGRDLAANLSLHGWGVGYFAASRLQQHITQATAIRWLAAQGTPGRGSKPRSGVPGRAVVKACEEWLAAASGENGDDGDNG